MTTLTLTAKVESDGTLRLEVPSGLPPGPVQVVLVLEQPSQGATLRWRDLRGQGREIWAGLDAQEYVNTLRDEWKR